MKKTRKTPKIILVVLITLLIVAGLFIFRSYILGQLGIGAQVGAETILRNKFPNDDGFLKDALVNVSKQTETADGAYLGRVYMGLNPAVSPSSCSAGDVSPACSRSRTATPTATTTSVSNGCTNLSSIKANIMGEPFHIGLSKSYSTANEINFGTKDSSLDSLDYSNHGVWVSRQNTFLRIKSIPANNDPVDLTIKFTGANLNNQSIKMVNTDPLETDEDTYSVNTSTNTVTLHFTAHNDDSDIDGIAIYFYCGNITPTVVTTSREGTISGTFDLGSVKTVTKVKLNPLSTKNLNNDGTGCIRTDINAKVSSDNQNWTNEQNSGSSTELIFNQPVQAKYVKYVFTLKSCNDTDTPKIASASVYGYDTTATASTSATATTSATGTYTATATSGTCSTTSPFTWKACVDGYADVQFNKTDPIVTILKYTYNAIGKHRDCSVKYNDTAALGTVSGSLAGCNKVEISKVEVLGGTGKAEYVTLSNSTSPFKINIKDNGGGPVDYLISLKCTECAAQTVTPTQTVTTTVTCNTSGCNTVTVTPTATASASASAVASVPNPPVPCDAQRPVDCKSPNPVATTTTTTQANGEVCSIQTCVGGSTPTATITAVSGIFGSPSGSASGFIVNGIKSGLSFYLIIAGVLIAGTVIVIRIAKAK